MRRFRLILAICFGCFMAPFTWYVADGQAMPSPEFVASQIENGQYQAAQTELSMVLSAHPYSGLAWYLLGVDEQRMGNANAAKPLFDEASRLLNVQTQADAGVKRSYENVTGILNPPPAQNTDHGLLAAFVVVPLAFILVIFVVFLLLSWALKGWRYRGPRDGWSVGIDNSPPQPPRGPSYTPVGMSGVNHYSAPAPYPAGSTVINNNGGLGSGGLVEGLIIGEMLSQPREDVIIDQPIVEPAYQPAPDSGSSGWGDNGGSNGDTGLSSSDWGGGSSSDFGGGGGGDVSGGGW